MGRDIGQSTRTAQRLIDGGRLAASMIHAVQASGRLSRGTRWISHWLGILLVSLSSTWCVVQTAVPSLQPYAIRALANLGRHSGFPLSAVLSGFPPPFLGFVAKAVFFGLMVRRLWLTVFRGYGIPASYAEFVLAIGYFGSALFILSVGAVTLLMGPPDRSMSVIVTICIYPSLLVVSLSVLLVEVSSFQESRAGFKDNSRYAK